MYLARVEMTGFKSFADKTVIEFDQGMTAVVGPNGSGKSNLSEAIRWVLGEQSAKSLRGSKMEDVIFNGTQDRKAVNLAKVTLVLNNEDHYLDYDFSEISITRSYNRNGESHYYINNESVRLKDIVDLLLDSGLGKNSFAMISQGKVESIFLNKPEERRAIFEEAAGVQKYQYRKIEAERKLTKSSDHLSRVKDIIHELETQLKPLKKQRETALKYQELQAELSDLEISLYTHQITQNRQSWDTAKEQLIQVNKVIDTSKNKVNATNTAIHETQTKLDQLLETLDGENEKYQEAVRHLEQTKAKLQMLVQEIQYTKASADDKSLQFEIQLQQQVQLQDQLTTIKQEIVTSENETESLRTAIKQLKLSQNSIDGLSEDQIEQLRNDLIEFYQQEARANNQVQQALSQQTYHENRLTQSQNRYALASETLSARQAQLEQTKKSFEQQQTLFQAHQAEHQYLSDQWQQIQRQREQLQQVLFQQERQHHALEAKVQSLRQMQEDYAGYYGGVRAIMKNADAIQGIDGTVADLIHVEAAYQVAIDTALGGALQHIVVVDDAAARRSIQYLKQERAGRATFLPRPHIKPRYLNEAYLNQARQYEDFIGTAVDIVSFDERDRAIIQNLLGATIVMKSVEQAQCLAVQLKHQVRIVTLDGEILMPGGSISGGRQKQQQNSMLSRQTELEQAIKALEDGKQLKAEHESKWQQLQRDDEQIRQQGEASRQQLSQYEQEIAVLQREINQLTQELKQASNEQIILKDEMTQSQQALKESLAEQQTANELAAKMKQEIENANQLLEQLNVSQSDRKQQLSEINTQLQQLTTQEAVKTTELRQLQLQERQLTEQLLQLSDYINHHQQTNVSDAQQLSQLEDNKGTLEAEIELLSKDLSMLQQQIEQHRHCRSELNQTLRELEANQQSEQTVVQEHYQRQAKLQAQIEKFEELIDNHLNYLNEMYQLSYEAAVEKAVAVESFKEVNAKVKVLRKSIDGLGPINLSAIEDYDALDERYQYLLEQQEDLLLAMAQLQTTMDEMDAEVIKRFSEAFNQINQQFKKTFKSLFAGGEAALELTDPDNLLTTGVDIIAQPPGKRKQNLALLSGGERAFTAIALLFAILETKPVPFCILDEVEAALDDANVWRYGEYLQHFTESTQFIVITHRKGTMEHADVLYGVTMERSGVSKLASVRLSEAKEM
ncbi:chromosome segregation protein SMC [Tuanshanicoccus lijuaniae]|uniref:chromosome segregation protein SMC n=1 Tax=Aerococcaceae bacterium zg-1292 TaxID=2774330 RepID=UPI001BD8189F|nr:chromosome segregation protein SMC [Aerococcaceae bacterium zg-A91]MBS4457573.1 chromosome segregation protein SMC [Aerococcaceae bacterium zg-BR33]